MHFPAMFDFEIGPNFGVCGTGTQTSEPKVEKEPGTMTGLGLVFGDGGVMTRRRSMDVN